MTDRMGLSLDRLHADLDQFERQLTIRLGALIVAQHVLLFAALLAVAFGALFIALHLWPPHG
jgi:hypothetical protein